LNFIYGHKASKAQARIGEGKGFGKVSARTYVEGASRHLPRRLGIWQMTIISIICGRTLNCKVQFWNLMWEFL